jgi:2-(1,2-epoxy-1,2-dihydrophenyl)acetyl-CoA isomerase
MSDRQTVDTGTDHLLAGIQAGVGEIVLNRPDRRNALSGEMLVALARVLDEFDRSDDVGAILLTGAGQAFCAGGDVKNFAATGGAGASGGPAVAMPERIARQLDTQRATVGRLHAMTTPVVAALPGAAAGAGLGLALAADLRIGCPRTVLVTAFAAVGLSGDYGTAWLLHRLVGPARSRELMFLSERVDADEALRLGLLTRVVPEDELLDSGRSLATRLAGGPRTALRHMKGNLLGAETDSLDEAMAREVPLHLECGTTAEHLAAVEAFAARGRR